MSENDELQMTIVEHLMELRDRIIKAGLALVGGMVIGVFFARRFLEVLLSPLGQQGTVQSLKPAENIMVFFKVALVLGAVIAMPVIFYEFMAFIAPGLTKEEKKSLLRIVPAATFLFALGVGFGAFVMLPFTLGYLQTFLSDLIKPNYSIDYYIAFVTNFTLAIGGAFETPLVIAFLARLGFVSPEGLRKGRRYAIVVIAILAAVITPTPDPFNMMLVMAPLLVLYEVGIILARLSYRPRPSFTETSSENAGDGIEDEA
ncbi:MAG: twin-arginine translocase subunit TatC [Anaerolineae bacterium]|nr:twin-arginine translocase subunit TatC [Anaerolineae bacterium]